MKIETKYNDIPWRIAVSRLTDVEDAGVILISTIKAPCLAWHGEYETAIAIGCRDWRIAEGYDTEEEAIKGHEKYTKMTRKELLELSYID